MDTGAADNTEKLGSSRSAVNAPKPTEARLPMTTAQACGSIAALKAQMPVNEQRTLLKVVLSPSGRLPKIVRAIFEARLRELDA